MSGGEMSRGGGTAAVMSASGGGGAGEDGGTAGDLGNPGKGGTFGPLPSGLTSTEGGPAGDPGGNTVNDYTTLCSGTAGKGAAVGPAGNGCVVLRCVP
jgi:hypothetical protein